MENRAIACPYCGTAIGFLLGEDVITIVCSTCNSHYTVDLKTQRVTKKRSGKKMGTRDEDETPEIKLKCPCGCSGYICNLKPADTIITVRCSNSGKFFGANLWTGRTWLLKKNKPRN